MTRLKSLSVICATAMMLLLWLPLATAQSELGSAQNYAVLGAATVTNTGSSIVTGDLGLSPGSALTGFPPGIVVGTIHINDGLAVQAQADANTAYLSLSGLACDVDLSGQDLGGLTLAPGVYCFTSTAQLTGTLTLDAMGDPTAMFVFQIGSALTTASAASVMVINGGIDCNVSWQVGSSATLGTNTSFIGTILASASVTLNTTASVSGRVIALNGAVTMDSNVIDLPLECQCTGPDAMVTNLGPGCDPLTDASLNSSLPVLGGTATISVSSASTPNAWVSLVASVPPVTPFDINGCQFYVDINNPANLILAVEGLLDANGNWSFGWPIPDLPALSGVQYILQGFVYAPTAPGAQFCFVFSNGLLVTIGCP